MVKDRLIVRMVFSGALIGFGILNIIYVILSKLFYKLKIRKDLRSIRDENLENIIQGPHIATEIINDSDYTKTEINKLLKEVYFDLYNKQKDDKEILNHYTDIENSIGNVLDNSILNIIEEKEKLLQEKDRLINILEEKNERFINDTITKISYIMQEKNKIIEEKDNIIINKDKIILDLESQNNKLTNTGAKKLLLLIDEKNKLLIEKDNIISTLYNRAKQEETFITKETTIQPDNKPKYHHQETFINVNN